MSQELKESKDTWRGKVRGMTEGEIDAFLEEPVNATLACLKPDGSPYVAICWQEWRDGAFWVIPRQRSRWAEYLKADPRVSLVIEKPSTMQKVHVPDGRAELGRGRAAPPSPNPPGDERAIAAVVQQAMAALGYRDLTTIACAEERPNGVGVVGTGPRTLILNGHLDTKPPGNEGAWQTGPYDPVIRDGRLYGLGSTDMKGAVAAMIYAGAAPAEAADLAGTLRLVLSADAEAGGGVGARLRAESRRG